LIKILFFNPVKTSKFRTCPYLCGSKEKSVLLRDWFLLSLFIRFAFAFLALVTCLNLFCTQTHHPHEYGIQHKQGEGSKCHLCSRRTPSFVLCLSPPTVIHQFDKWHLCVSQSETIVATRIIDDQYCSPQFSFHRFSS